MKTSKQKIPAAGCAIRRILTDTGAAIVADDIYLDGGLREYEAFHVILTGTVSGCTGRIWQGSFGQQCAHKEGKILMHYMEICHTASKNQAVIL